MIDDSDAILDDLMCRWHQWGQSARICRGFAPKSLVVGDYRISRQHDDINGALDSDLDASRMKAVDFAVGCMLDPYKAAIYAQARALVSGAAVWTSPRLPADPAERAAIVVLARSMLTVRLRSAGVL
jgi:hypothetical protein